MFAAFISVTRVEPHGPCGTFGFASAPERASRSLLFDTAFTASCWYFLRWSTSSLPSDVSYASFSWLSCGPVTIWTWPVFLLMRYTAQEDRPSPDGDWSAG